MNIPEQPEPSGGAAAGAVAVVFLAARRAFHILVWLQLTLAGGASAALDPQFAVLGDAALAALIRESLERNPGILRARMNSRAGYHRIVQATALPDPTLGITWHAGKPETRTGPQRKSLSISQRIPWPGKRADRGRIAAADAQVQSELVRVEEMRVVREVKSAYYDLAYMDLALAINAEQEQLLRHYESLARARYAQGLGPQQGAIRLQAEITRVLNQRRELQRRRLETGTALDALRDVAMNAPVSTEAIGRVPPVPVDDERLQAKGRDHHPEIKVALLMMEAERDRVRLERRRHFPDFTLGASWGDVGNRRDPAGRAAPPPDNGKDVYSLTVGVNVPIYRARYDAAVREANARLESAKAAHRDVLVAVRRAVRNAGLRLTTVAEQLRLFETALLPQAEQALGSAEAAYATGTAGIADLLDSETVLFEVRLGLARLASDYMRGLAEMEWAIGAPFPDEPFADVPLPVVPFPDVSFSEEQP